MNLINEIPSRVRAHIPIKEVILQAGIASKAKNLCMGLGSTLLICDENTKGFVNLPGDKLILPASQKPELTLAKEIAAAHKPDYFIAVGSGSLNDIVKYAAYLAGKPYIIFGTAPSMNGYVSANTSLLENGYKKSFYAASPHCVYLDLEILAAAPRRLINSGIGDSICRATAQADAILARQALGGDDYAELFTLIKKYEDGIFDNIETLATSLVMSGIAMLLAKSSAPASQGEHMLAHYMELMQPSAPQSYHGEQIAVTTVTMAALQEKLLNGRDYIELNEANPALLAAHFGKEFGTYCAEQTHKKYASLLGKKIPINKAEIEAALVSAETIREKLIAISAPTTPTDICWDSAIYKDALQFTRYTRDRFTFLDLI